MMMMMILCEAPVVFDKMLANEPVRFPVMRDVGRCKSFLQSIFSAI